MYFFINQHEVKHPVAVLWPLWDLARVFAFKGTVSACETVRSR
jgi:hypothetical protein